MKSGAKRAASLETLEPRQMLSGWMLLSDGFAAEVGAGLQPLAAVAKEALGAKPQANDDFGNTFGSAKAIVLDSTGAANVSGKIDYVGDIDVFSLTASVTGTMKVDMTATASRKNSLNCELFAYNGSQVLLVANDDFAGSTNSQVTFEVVAGRTYYLQATGHAGTVGAYGVKIATQAAPEPPPAPEPTPPPPEPTPPPPEPTPPPADYVPGATVAGRVETTASGLQLVILGTDGADTITLSQSAGTITLITLSASTAFTGPFSRLLVYGFGGNDTIRLTYSVSTSALIYAGSGNDSVFENGTSSADVYGEAGDDLLVTVGGGSDRVWGGGGLDSFWVDSADTIGDVESAEAPYNVHRIGAFYQPVPTDPTKFVSLEIAGQDIVDPATASPYANFSSSPLFVDGPEFNDTIQGAVGDCYLLAALSSLALSDPDIVRQMITALGDGTYAVRFYRGGQEAYLRIDAQLPVYYGDRLKFARMTPDGELWVALVEKAYAQFRTGANSYASLDGGWMTAVYPEVTNVLSTSATTSTLTSEALAQYISTHLQDGHAVSAGSYATATSPIVYSHAYTIKSIENVAGQWQVTVYNVWGQDGVSWDSNSGDGLLTISIDLFRQNFSKVCVSLA